MLLTPVSAPGLPKPHPKPCRGVSCAKSSARPKLQGGGDTPAEERLDWVPKMRALPTVCVVSTMTGALLDDWGGVAVEANANWAVAHGYRYTVFTAPLMPPTLHAVWSNPRAVQRVLEMGESECARVFYLDGDALINDVSRRLEPLLERFLPATSSTGAEVIATCHSPFADEHGGCLGPRDGSGWSACTCGRAAMATACTSRKYEKMVERKVLGKAAVPWCFINSGAFLLRNAPRSRALVAQWVGMRGCDPGQPGKGAPEQACIQHLHKRWRATIDIVSAKHFNAPAWHHSRLEKARDPIRAYESARSAPWAPIGKDGKRVPGASMQCFNDSSSFVCHMWNAMRYDKPTVREVRRVVFAASATQRRPQLLALLAARGEVYVSITEKRRGTRTTPGGNGTVAMLAIPTAEPTTPYRSNRHAAKSEMPRRKTPLHHLHHQSHHRQLSDVAAGPVRDGSQSASPSTAALLYVQLGPWPPWLPFLLRSAAANSRAVTSYLLGPLLPEGLVCSVGCSWGFLGAEQLSQRIRRHLNLTLPPKELTKFTLCDLKPMLPALFPEIAARHAWVGYADSDILWGDLASEVEELQPHHDLLVPSMFFPSPLANGNLLLMRSSQRLLYAFARSSSWAGALQQKKYFGFDEWYMSNEQRKKYPAGSYFEVLHGMFLDGELNPKPTRRHLAQDTVPLGKGVSPNAALLDSDGARVSFSWRRGVLRASRHGPCLCSFEKWHFGLESCSDCFRRSGVLPKKAVSRRNLEVLGVHYQTWKHCWSGHPERSWVRPPPTTRVDGDPTPRCAGESFDFDVLPSGFRCVTASQDGDVYRPVYPDSTPKDSQQTASKQASSSVRDPAAPLVIGLHTGMPADAGLSSFLQTLRRVRRGAPCEIVVLSEQAHVGRGVAAACERHAAELFEYVRADYPFRDGWNATIRSQRWNYRYLKALKFAVARSVLAGRRPTGLVLLADISDTLFQADPFGLAFDPATLYLSAEANIFGDTRNPSSVGNVPMLLSDGRDPAQFTGRPILNSGAILSGAKAMRQYLGWLLQSRAGWDDQARLNAYARQFPERITAPPLTSSRMLTFDRLDLDRFSELDCEGRVLNCDGVPYVLMHRIDSCIGRRCLQVPLMGPRLKALEKASGARKLGHGSFVNDVGCSKTRGSVSKEGVAVPHHRHVFAPPRHVPRDHHEHEATRRAKQAAAMSHLRQHHLHHPSKGVG